MPRSSLRLLLSTAFACVVFSLGARADAAEFQLRGGIGGEATTWRDDGAFVSQLALGIRFADLVSVYFLGRVGGAAVDQRMLTTVSLGAQIWAPTGLTRPYLRLGLVHEHEETWAAVGGDVPGALFGVGDGIAHRGGFETAIGIDRTFAGVGACRVAKEDPKTCARRTQFFATVEALTTWFPMDNKGPTLYAGGTLGLGLNYSL